MARPTVEEAAAPYPPRSPPSAAVLFRRLQEAYETLRAQVEAGQRDRRIAQKIDAGLGRIHEVLRNVHVPINGAGDNDNYTLSQEKTDLEKLKAENDDLQNENHALHAELTALKKHLANLKTMATACIKLMRGDESRGPIPRLATIEEEVGDNGNYTLPREKALLDKLEAENCVLQAENDVLQVENHALQAEVIALKKQLADVKMKAAAAEEGRDPAPRLAAIEEIGPGIQK